MLYLLAGAVGLALATVLIPDLSDDLQEAQTRIEILNGQSTSLNGIVQVQADSLRRLQSAIQQLTLETDSLRECYVSDGFFEINPEDVVLLGGSGKAGILIICGELAHERE